MTGPIVDALRTAAEAQTALADLLAEVQVSQQQDIWEQERARMLGVVLAVTAHTEVPCQAGAHSRAVCRCKPADTPRVRIPAQRRPIGEEIGSHGERARRAAKVTGR